MIWSVHLLVPERGDSYPPSYLEEDRSYVNGRYAVHMFLPILDIGLGSSAEVKKRGACIDLFSPAACPDPCLPLHCLARVSVIRTGCRRRLLRLGSIPTWHRIPRLVGRMVVTRCSLIELDQPPSSEVPTDTTRREAEAGAIKCSNEQLRSTISASKSLGATVVR